MTVAKNKNYRYLLQSRKTKATFYYWLKKIVLCPLMIRWLDIRAEGLDNIPAGPCIIVTHHCLYFDSSVIGATLERKPHGWIDEDAFSKPGLRLLCSFHEQIPVKTGRRFSREEYRKTKEMSHLWLRNTNEFVALTNDGASKYILDENGDIKGLSSRMNHSGAASLGIETGAPIIPVASWISEEHQRELFVSRGLKSIRYLERNRKIPYRIFFSEPIHPSQYQNKKELKEDIRKRQMESYKKL
ncbi:1-acyl-sn-glycerol-3-phosphate acyltransferase [bacterium]|nr:1-acyl-sn-glycerol-3-phosphate acyltransferase [bacterium]